MEIYRCNKYIDNANLNDGITYEIKQVYNVNMLRNNNIVRAGDGKYTIVIDLPTKLYMVNCARVLAEKEDGSVEVINCSAIYGQLVFETDNITRFVLIGEQLNTLEDHQLPIFIVTIVLTDACVIAFLIILYFANPNKMKKILKYIDTRLGE